MFCQWLGNTLSWLEFLFYLSIEFTITNYQQIFIFKNVFTVLGASTLPLHLQWVKVPGKMNKY